MDAQRVNKGHHLNREAAVPTSPILCSAAQIAEALRKQTANSGNVAGVEIMDISVKRLSFYENTKYNKPWETG